LKRVAPKDGEGNLWFDQLVLPEIRPVWDPSPPIIEDSGRLKGSVASEGVEAPLVMKELAGLPGVLGTGVFVRDIHTPSTSTPLSSALIPKGTSSAVIV
jgi:hypothetical protein